MAHTDNTAPVKRSKKTMTDGELCALIDHERSNGIGYADQLSSDRTRAMAYYLGEASYELTPPDVDGRSKIVSKDLLEVVESAMPSLMRMFCGADDVIRFEAEGPEDEKNASDATEYCGWMLFRKNNGFTVLHDAIKSALISRMGVVKVYCEEAWDEREEHYCNLSEQDVQALSVDENVEIVEQALVMTVEVSVSPDGSQAQPQQPYYDVTARRKEKKCNIVVEGVPPEEIWFSKDSREIDKLRCVGQNTERTVSDLISMGYDPDKVSQIPTGDDEGDTYGERLERESYDGSFTVSEDDDSPDPSQRVVTLQLAYIRVDYDGDGVAEYRRIVKAGNVVFENDIVDDHEFALCCPNLMPYKLIGLGMWDLTEDIQRIKTAVTRQYLDNLYLANNPRIIANPGEVNLDDLLNPRPGGIIRTKGDPSAVRELVTTDVGPNAQAGITYFDTVRDNRTGIKQFSQGLVGEELSKSQIGSEGVAMLTDQADQRLELIARVIAETFISRIYRLLLKNATQYQDREAQIKVNGNWMAVDPRAWKNNYAMSVSIGIGTSSKAKQIQNAMMLLQIQQQAAQYNLVQPQNAYNSLEDLLAAMGKKDTGRYFTAPGQGPEQPPAPDPALIKIQAETQAKMAELQQQGQLQAQKQQGDVEVERMKQEFQAQQAQAETQLEAQRNQMQAETDMQLAREKAELDFKLAIAKAQMAQETAITVARINAEAKILSAKTMGAKDASTADADANYQEARE